MDRAPLPLTTETGTGHETTDFGAPNTDDSDYPDDRTGPKSDTDVLASAASPGSFAPVKRWDQFLLFNLVVPILLILVGVGVISLFGSAAPKPLPPPDLSPAAVLQSLPATQVARIQSLEETGRQLELAIDGTVVPFREARVSSEVAGRVIYKSENCEAGAIVSKGELLMRIDPTDYQFETERLTRSTEEATRMLDEVDQEAVNTKRLIEVANRDIELQQKDVNRQMALKRFGSEAELDRAKSALLQAEQQLVTLNNQLELLRSRRSRLEASKQLTESQLRLAEVNLDRCEVTAPISGVIVSEQADLNTFVNRGTALVVIEDTSKAEVAANMRMDQLHWVLDQNGSSAGGGLVKRTGYDLPDTKAIIEYEVAGRSGTVHRWEGTLVSYDGIGIDPNTRTVPVRILVDDPSHYWDEGQKVEVSDTTTALLRGMFVRVRLQLVPRADLIAVPARALRPGNRVWRFSKDPSVLGERLAELESKYAEAIGSDAVPPAEQETKPEPADDVEVVETFDPSLWAAGRVAYSKRVFPVDSLGLAADAGDDLPPTLQSANRLWICEAEQSDLKAGDLVVVSPLDSIPPEGLPARAEIKP